jgi:hypothetical protein
MACLQRPDISENDKFKIIRSQKHFGRPNLNTKYHYLAFSGFNLASTQIFNNKRKQKFSLTTDKFLKENIFIFLFSGGETPQFPIT